MEMGGASFCYNSMAKDINALSGPSHNGQIIPPWSVTAQEYEVLYHFPDFTKRFDIGRDCLTLRGNNISIHIIIYFTCRKV